MHLEHLSLTNYRIFNRLDMDLPRRILLLIGANAQGKTSLLEAIYYLSTCSSFQTQNDRQLISFLAGDEALAVARIVGSYRREDRSHRLEIRLIQTANGSGGISLRKEILLDGVKRTAHEALGHFNAVIFLPQMTRIIEEGPEERRRYLNMAISQAVPGYAQALNEYQQALSQRNALLKLLAERGGDADQLLYWDELLARRGAYLMRIRISAIDELERLSARIHHRLTNSQEVLRFIYQPAYDPLPEEEGQYRLPLQTPAQRNGISEEQIYKGFIQRLQSLRSEEIARGLTTIGPHRDELRFLSNGIDLCDFGSRGQIRTTLMSLKFAEVSWLKEKTGSCPVLLLDEVLAELDNQHRSDLMSFVETCDQVIMASTDLHMFPPELVKNNQVWQIEGGRVHFAED